MKWEGFSRGPWASPGSPVQRTVRRQELLGPEPALTAHFRHSGGLTCPEVIMSIQGHRESIGQCHSI